MNTKSDWITLYEIANRFGVCKKTARKLVSANNFRILKLFGNNSTIRVLRKDIEDYEKSAKKAAKKICR